MTDNATRPSVATQLAEFWRELLDTDAVDQDDRLLEVGGNSLVATMLANRIELAWGFRPGMEELMTASFRELVSRCEESRGF